MVQSYAKHTAKTVRVWGYYIFQAMGQLGQEDRGVQQPNTPSPCPAPPHFLAHPPDGCSAVCDMNVIQLLRALTLVL